MRRSHLSSPELLATFEIKGDDVLRFLAVGICAVTHREQLGEAYFSGASARSTPSMRSCMAGDSAFISRSMTGHQ
jgi:hypothetical protein